MILCAWNFLQRLKKDRFSKNLVRIDIKISLHIETFPYPGGSKLTPVALDCTTFRLHKRPGTSPKKLAILNQPPGLFDDTPVAYLYESSSDSQRG